MFTVTDPDKLEEALLPRDPDARARYLSEREHKLAKAAVAERARGFAMAVATGEYDLAGRLFLAERGYTTRLEFIRELEGDQVPDLCRHSTGEVREAILAAHPNRPTIERQLVPTERLPRMVRIARRQVGESFELVAATDPRPVDSATAARLMAAGDHLVKSDKRTGDERYTYRGWTPSEALIRTSAKNDGGVVADWENEAAFLARLEVDRELVRIIREGRLVVSTHTERGPAEDAPELAAIKSEAQP
jgi:hypothetical protein